MIYYRIVGQDCGRDKRGRFTCVCGKCKPIASDDLARVTTAATIAAIAEIAEMTVLMTNRRLSVRSFEAGVSIS